MGRQVNVVLASGKVVSVDEETAKLAGKTGFVHEESQGEGAQRVATEATAEKFSDPGYIPEAALLGAADTLTFGGIGKLATSIGGTEAQRFRGVAEEHGVARFGGEVAALLAPTGWLGNGAKVAAEASPLFRVTNAIAKVGGEGKALTLAAEGAAFGIGSHIAESNLSGDPLTIEGTMQSAGVGAILNFGLGKLTNAIFGKTADAVKIETDKAAHAAATQAAADARIAAKQGVKTAKAEYDTVKTLNEAEINTAQAEVKTLKQQTGETANQFKDVLSSTPTTYSDLIQTQAATKQAAKEAEKRSIEQFDELVKLQTKQQVDYDTAKLIHEGRRKAFKNEFLAYDTALETLHTDHAAIGRFLDNVDALERHIPGFEAALKKQAYAPDDIAVRVNELRKSVNNARSSLDSGDAENAYFALSRGFRDVKDIRPRIKLPSDLVELPSIPSPGKFNKGPRPTITDVSLRPKLSSDNVPNFPKTIGDLADMDTNGISRLANSIDNGSPLHDSLNKFADDIGLAPSTTAAETLAGIHDALQDIKSLAKGDNPSLVAALKTLDDAQLKAASEEAVAAQKLRDASNVPVPPKPAALPKPAPVQGGLVGGLARVAWKFGPTGAAAGLVAGSMMAARKTLAESAHDFLVKFGQKTAQLSKNLQPLNSYLGTSILTGERGSSKDIRDMALERIKEIDHVQTYANDASYTAVQGLGGMPNDIGYKLHTALVGAIGYMGSQAPRDPGLTNNLFSNTWKPSYAEALKFASVIEAVLSPMQAISRLIAGQGTTQAADALWTVYPATMGRMAEGLASGAASFQNVTREQSSALGRLFRIPLNGFQTPQVLSGLQSQFTPTPNEGPGVPPSKRPTGGAPGRPAAISNTPNPTLTKIQQLQR